MIPKSQPGNVAAVSAAIESGGVVEPAKGVDVVERPGRRDGTHDRSDRHGGESAHNRTRGAPREDGRCPKEAKATRNPSDGGKTPPPTARSGRYSL